MEAHWPTFRRTAATFTYIIFLKILGRERKVWKRIKAKTVEKQREREREDCTPCVSFHHSIQQPLQRLLNKLSPLAAWNMKILEGKYTFANSFSPYMHVARGSIFSCPLLHVSQPTDSPLLHILTQLLNTCTHTKRTCTRGMSLRCSGRQLGTAFRLCWNSL